MSEQQQELKGTMERSVDGLELARAERAALIEAAGLVSEGVVICDNDGQIAYESDATVLWLHQNDQSGLATEALNEVLLSARLGQRITRSLEFLGPPRRALALNGVPVFNEHQEPIGAVAVLENTTERRHHEALLRDFVANVSHELKTPVGALGLLAEALLVETAPEVVGRLVERMQVEAARVTRVIDDLLDLSRIESITAPLREMVSVEAIVTQAVAGVNYLSEHRNIEIKLDIAGEPTVYGGMREIISAIHHLLENAIKYSPDGSFVELHAKSDGDWTEISVQDHGLGISPKDVDRIFERFYRVDDARKRTTGGTGLGLSIVRQVIQQHGGDVRVKSQEGEGSTFILRLASKPSVANERLVIEGGEDG